MAALILTTHARERLALRKLSVSEVEAVLRNPDKTLPGKKPQTHTFIRNLNGRLIHVIANYEEKQKKWLIVSVWVRGEDDPTPFVWQLLTLPFKLSWWLVKKLVFKQKRRRE